MNLSKVFHMDSFWSEENILQAHSCDFCIHMNACVFVLCVFELVKWVLKSGNITYWILESNFDA